VLGEREGRGKECWCYSGPPAEVVVVVSMQAWAACVIYWKLQITRLMVGPIPTCLVLRILMKIL